MRIAITGCSSGIGAATARLFKSRGAHVTGFDVAAPGGDVDAFVSIDLSEPHSIKDALHRASGPFDALCNIAGLPPRPGNERQVLAVNLIGLQQFTRGMFENLTPDASIVNLASRAGQHWLANIEQVKRTLALRHNNELAAFIAQEKIDHVRAYDLSKEALIVWSAAMTEPLFARRLRMNTVSPGAVSSPILGDFMAAFGGRVAANLARAGRATTPDEVADVVAFLASPESRSIKGVDVGVDGGIGAFMTSDRLGLGGLA